MARQYDIIWAAGFFDGEGCVRIENNVRREITRYNLSVSAFQNVQKPVDTLQSLFGGAVNVRPNEGWLWRAYGDIASEALKQMLPYMQVKALQAMAAIEFQKRKLDKGANYPDFETRRLMRELDALDYQTLRDLKQVV